MTTTHSQSSTLFNDLAALLTGQLFLLKTLPMNRCANSGMASRKTRRDRSLFKCGRCDPYSALDTGTWATAFSSSAGHEIFGRSLREMAW